MADNMPLVARIMVQHGGGGPPTGPGVAKNGDNGGDPVQKKIKENSDRQLKQGKSHLAKTIGINIGTASILKQSQVFTGYLGTIFQLMGALVDVILAPFLPILIPAIKLLASFIPIARNIMELTVGSLVRGFQWLVELMGKANEMFGRWPEKIGGIIITGMKYVLVSVLIGMFLTKLVGLGKVSNVIFKYSFGLMIKGIQWLYHHAKRMLGFKQKEAILDTSTKAVNTAMLTPGSIYVKDIMGAKGAAAGRRGAARGAARNARGTNSILSKVSKNQGGLLRTSGKFFGRNLMRLGGVGLLLTGMTGMLGRGFSSLTHSLGKGFSLIKGGLGLNTSATTRLVPRLVPPMGKNASLLSRIIGAAKTAAFATGRFIAAGVSGGFGIIKGGLTVAKDAIVSGARNGWNAVTSGLSTAKDFIANKFPIIGKAVDAVKTRLGLMKDAVVGGLNAAKTAITGSLTSLGSKIGGFFGGMGKLLNKIPGVSKAVEVAKDVGKAVKEGFSKAKNFLFGGGGAKAGEEVGEEAAKKAGGLFGRISRSLPMLGKAARVLPGVNVLFEAGYGIYKTIDDFKKYGWKAAMGRATMSAGLTTAALFSNLIPGGTLAVGAGSIAGHMGMDYAYGKNLTPRNGNGGNGNGMPTHIDITMNMNDRLGAEQDRQNIRAQVDSNQRVTVNANMPSHIGPNANR